MAFYIIAGKRFCMFIQAIHPMKNVLPICTIILPVILFSCKKNKDAAVASAPVTHIYDHRDQYTGVYHVRRRAYVWTKNTGGAYTTTYDTITIKYNTNDSARVSSAPMIDSPAIAIYKANGELYCKVWVDMDGNFMNTPVYQGTFIGDSIRLSRWDYTSNYFYQDTLTGRKF